MDARLVPTNRVLPHPILLPLVLLLAVCALPVTVLAQSSAADSAAVIEAGHDYIDLFYEGDESVLERTIHTDVFKYGFGRPQGSDDFRPGQEMTREQMRAFAQRVRERGEAPDPDWPRDVEILDLMDQTAMVKVRAWWGYDYLGMGRVDGRWQIVQVLWQSPPVS